MSHRRQNPPPWGQNATAARSGTSYPHTSGVARGSQRDHSASLCPPPPPVTGALPPPPMYPFHPHVALHAVHSQPPLNPLSRFATHSLPYAPPAAPHSGPHQTHPPSLPTQHAREASATSHQFRCDPCQASMESESALQAHVSSHIACTECSFSGSRKVVKGHFQSVHGKFSGRGFKSITVAVPGCRVQRFRICVGSHPDDIQKWIQERKRRFPRQSQTASGLDDGKKATNDCAKDSRVSEGLGSLLEGYGSSSSDGSGDHTTRSVIENPPLDASSAKYRTRPCRYFMRNGTCRNGDACNFSHELTDSGRMHNHHARESGIPRRTPKSRSSMTLLRKLLDTDSRRERMLTIQLLRYLVDCNYLQEQRPRPSAQSTSLS